MKLSMAKATTLGLLLAGLAIGLTGQFTLDEGTQMYVVTEVLTLVLLAGGIAVGAIWARCPYCGKSLFMNMLKWKNCPRCNRALTDKTAKSAKRK